MGINFIQPYWLLLLPIVISIVFIFNRHVKKLVRWRKNTVLFTRTILFIFLILALAGMNIQSYSDETTTIFVVDRSDSTAKSEETIKKFINHTIENKRNKDGIGIVSFGANALVEQSISKQPKFNGFQTNVKANYSNIEAGLKLAYSLMPTGTRKRVVLITDGQENIGNATQQAKVLQEQGIVVDIVELEKAQVDDVQISQISVPEYIHINEQYDIIVKVDSNVKTPAKIQLYADNQPVAQQEVEIQRGTNRFVFKDRAVKGGNIVYKAVIDAEIDDVSRNNQYSQFTYVKDTPHILAIEGSEGEAREIAKIFQTDANVQIISPSSAPQELVELQQYDSVILSNVSAEDLTDKFMEILESYVKHLGKGLIVTGGEDSYALGGYFKTPIEKILPVEMDLKNKADVPNLGLVLIIDKSGSMTDGQYGISKIELAKEAAIRSTEALRDEDQLGVIAFDGSAQWVVKTGVINDIREVQEKIGSIRADGGTSILPALDEGVKSLIGRDTKLKHIILLTDGQAESYGYDGLIQIMKKEGITLSTVAVGTGADIQLLNYLAENGSGRFYKTDEFSDLPKIFTKETFLAGKTYINNRSFTPSLVGSSEIMNNIQALPYLDGYIGTTSKKTANIILASDQDDPILASWQYGLGKVVAWTSDTKGQWTSDWMAWNKSITFWKNILSWTLQQNQMEGYQMDARAEGDQVHLTLKFDDAIANKQIEGIAVGPDMIEKNIEFQAIAPGEYKAQFQSDDIGAYMTRINIIDPDGKEESLQTGIVLPYSAEYDLQKQNSEDYLLRLAKAGGGQILKDTDEALTEKLKKAWTKVDITPILIVLAILFLMFDIAIRRLNIPSHKIQKALDKASNAWDIANKSVKTIGQKLHPYNKNHNKNRMQNIDTKSKSRNSVQVETEEKEDNQKAKPTEQPTHTSRLLDMKKKRNIE